jgi:hypothetical protein
MKKKTEIAGVSDREGVRKSKKQKVDKIEALSHARFYKFGPTIPSILSTFCFLLFLTPSRSDTPAAMRLLPRAGRPTMTTHIFESSDCVPKLAIGIFICCFLTPSRSDTPAISVFFFIFQQIKMPIANFGTQSDDSKICVVMVGLPARGKSLIAGKGKLAFLFVER